MIQSVLVLTVPFIFVIVITWLKIEEKRKRNQLQADLYAKAIENGQPVPTDLFAEPVKKRNPLNTGIILIAVGVGISLFFWMMSISSTSIIPSEASNGIMSATSIGVIPFLIGVAFVIIHFIEKKKVANKDAK